MKTSFGHSVPVYDMERTICDLIRSRNHIEMQPYQDTLDADTLRQALAATSHKRQSEHMLLEGDEILKEVEASPVM